MAKSYVRPTSAIIIAVSRTANATIRRRDRVLIAATSPNWTC